jgi:hypothetical protein
VAGDINGDGLPDLVTANELADSLSVFLSLGPVQYAPALTYGVGADPRYALAGDLDGDGSVDILSANHTSYDFSVFFNRTPESAAPVYRERVCTELDFHRVSLPTGGTLGATRFARFLVPASGEGGLTVYENSERYPSQREFLSAAFPQLFPALTPEAYEDLVGRRATRQHFSGRIARLHSRTSHAYGFSLYVSAPDDPAERLTLGEVRAAYAALSSTFSLRPLFYYPESALARQDAASWASPGFQVVTALYRRGDASAEGAVNVADAVAVLGHLFGGSRPLPCLQAGDANDDGKLDLSDAVFILRYLFIAGVTIPQVDEGCSWDRTPDALRCAEFPPCGP